MKPGGSFNHFDIRVVGVQWFWHQSGGCFNHFDIRWNHGQPELAPSTELDSQPGLQQWSPAIAHSIMRFIISYIISYIIRTISSYNISICLIPHYIQQCSHPSKFLEICNNVSPNPIRQKSQEFVWITTIMSGRAKLDQVYLVLTIASQYEEWFWPACIEAKICLPSISCLCKLLILKADEADGVPAKYYFINHLQSVSILGPSISVPFLPWLSILVVERGVHFGIGMSGELLMMMRNLMDTVSTLESEWCGTGWGVVESLSLEILRALMMYPYFAHSPLVWMKSSTLAWVQETGIPSLKVHWTTPIIIERFYLELR